MYIFWSTTVTVMKWEGLSYHNDVEEEINWEACIGMNRRFVDYMLR